MTSLASPALAAQNLGPKAEANILVENTQHLRNAVKLYNIARKLAEKSGPQAFVDELPAHILSDERKYFLREINRAGPLPELQMTDTHVLVIEDKLQVAALDIRQILSGVFVFPRGTYHYNFKHNAIQNMERWKAQGKSTEKMNASLRFLEWINPLPQAHAFSTTTGVVVGALLGALIGVMIKKWFFPEKPADHGSEATTTPEMYTPPPAAAGPTTPADGSTPPPSGSGLSGPGNGNAEPEKKPENELTAEQKKAEIAKMTLIDTPLDKTLTDDQKRKWWFGIDPEIINKWRNGIGDPKAYAAYLRKVLDQAQAKEPNIDHKFRKYVLNYYFTKAGIDKLDINDAYALMKDRQATVDNNYIVRRDRR